MGILVVKIIGLVIVAIGVIGIYDARDLSKKFFSNADRNNSVAVLRIVGFLVAIVGAILIYFFI